MESIAMILKQTYGQMGEMLSHIGPKVVAGAILVVAGLVVARLLKAAVYHLLRAIKFESAAAKLGLTNVLKRADVEHTSSEIICTLVYWTCMLFAVFATLGAVGIGGAAAMSAVLALIPKVVLAVTILVLGVNVSAFVSKLVQTAAVNAEIRQARLVRNVMHAGLCAMVVLLAIKPFDISSQLLGNAFLIFLGGVSLAMGLSFGMGCRDLAGSIARSTWQKEQEQAQALSEASELGNDFFPSQTQRRPQRGRTLAA